MADDWQQVNVRVRESTYEEWKEAADSEYGGMTDLIRTSVRRELDGHHGAVSGSETDTDDGTTTEVAEKVDRLENTLRDMDKRLSSVKESVESTGSVVSVKAAVRETVPVIEGEPSSTYYLEQGLTVTEIAARLNADESVVSEALSELQSDGIVEGATGGESSETVYVRSGGL